MTCSKCGGKQFYTKRSNHKPVCWVCSKCFAEVLIKKPKQSKELKENKDGEE